MSSENGKVGKKASVPVEVAVEAVATRRIAPAKKARNPKKKPKAEDAPKTMPASSLPDLSALSLDAIQGLEAEVARQVEAISAWVPGFLTSLEAYSQASEDVKAKIQKGVEQGQSALSNLLFTEETKAYRRAAWLAYYQHMLAKAGTQTGADAVLAHLLSANLLETSDSGPIVIGYGGKGRAFQIPETSFFTQKEVTVVQRLVQAMLSRIEKYGESQHKARVEALHKKSKVTILELAAGKVGGCCLAVVPPEQIDEEHWRAGGEILVEPLREGNETWLYAIDVDGNPGFVRSVQEAIDLEACVPLSAVVNGRLTRVGEFAKTEDRQKKTKLLYHVLSRALKFAKKEEECDKLMEEFESRFKSQPTYLLAEAFLIDKRDGIGVVRIDGTFTFKSAENLKKADKSVDHVFFAASRSGETLTLLEVPEHAKEFLGGFIGKGYKESDGLPPRLQNLMKTARQQMERKKRLETV